MPVRAIGYNELSVLKRIRQLHISLAAKLQLLFGAAVALIIAAALFVPWQRMEQLTGQLNQRAAATLAAEVMAGQSIPGNGWGKSSPADQARRSIYIHVKRSLITPVLASSIARQWKETAK